MEEKYKICPYCGEKIRYNAIKCRFCKEWLAMDYSNYNIEFYLKNILADKYQILEEIGKGGMSIVYKAIQKNLERVVALKVLSEMMVEDNELLEMFHYEARAIAQLSHPNIIIIYDDGDINGIHYISMKYIDGGSLRDKICLKGKLSYKEAKNILLPIMDALEYAHNKGVIHGDIKSSNILIDSNDVPVLTDFGIALKVGESANERNIYGTPEYMSPEQARGGVIDKRSDIYSIGVLLYETLTGRLPFIGNTLEETIRKIVDEKPINPRKINEDIPEYVEYVIMKCLEKNPEERFNNVSELKEALLGSYESRTIFKYNNTDKEKRKRKRPFKLVSAFTVLIIISAIVYNSYKSNTIEFNNIKNKIYNVIYRKKKANKVVVKKLTFSDSVLLARDYMSKGMTLVPLNNCAYSILIRLRKSHPMNQAVKDMLDEIKKGFLNRINSLIEKEKYKLANDIIQEGLVYFPKDREIMKKWEVMRVHPYYVKALRELKEGNLYDAIKSVDSSYAITRDYEKINQLAEQIGEKYYEYALRCYDTKDYRKCIKYCNIYIKYLGNNDKILSLRRKAQNKLNEMKREQEKERYLNMIEWVYIKGGSYDMGDVFNMGIPIENPPINVTVSDFYISKYEITYNQFRSFIDDTKYITDAERVGGNNWRSPGFNVQNENYPVVYVSWNDAVEFCRWLSSKTGENIRLPYEKEWEYAARGGGMLYRWSGTSNDAYVMYYGWYAQNSDGRIHVVGRKTCNQLGIYDMSGNVMEWCYDEFRSYDGSQISGYDDNYKVVRGGAWNSLLNEIRTTARKRIRKDTATNYLGFRVCKDIESN